MTAYFGFQWDITNACDQRCRHCYIFSDKTTDPAVSMKPHNMHRMLENILDFCSTYNRSPYLYLTGGDPLLHPAFWDFLSELHNRQIPYAVLGNPFHISPEAAQRLHETGCRKYQMSLDGLEETHDYMRKPGSFQETLRKLHPLHDAGIQTVIMATVSSVNIGDMAPLMAFLADYPVDLFAFARFCNTETRKGNGLTPLAYRHLLDECYRLSRSLYENGSQLRLAYKDHLWTLYNFEERRFQIPQDADPHFIYEGCSCGAEHLTILPDGTVYACRRVNSPVGNALRERLADIWVNDAMERYRDFSAFEKCAHCKLLAWCRGCPAVSAASGGFYSADPQCWKAVGCEGSTA